MINNYLPAQFTLLITGAPTTQNFAAEDAALHVQLEFYLIHEVPEVHTGQIIWEEGKIVDAKLSGCNVVVKPDADGNTQVVAWNTALVPPSLGGDSTLALAYDERQFAHVKMNIGALDGPLATIQITIEASPPQDAKHSQVTTLQVSEYPSHTAEEWTACMNLIDDGSRRLHITVDTQRGSIRHHRPKARFSTELLLLDDEREAGHGIELLQGALDKLDADDKLIWLYVSQLLAPVEPLLQNTFAGGWVDLDSVARKTLGGYARNPQEKEERRAKVYHAIRMGARTEIIGSRSVPYVDKQTGQVIDTRLHTSPWKIMGREMPEQPTLFAVDTIPLRVELVASREWSALTTHRDTAQYLPFGEVIGAIPGSKAGGAWARALGLAFFDWCRMNPAGALAETPALFSRQWFLERHRAKIAPYDEVLAGEHPADVWKHWHAAEGLLRETGLIEAPPSLTKPPQRQGWATEWKREPPLWKPGPILRPVLESLAQNKFVEKPRQLNPAKRKLGRPRKKPPAE